MKKLILIVLIIGVLMLSGCGSDTNSTQKVNVKSEPAAPKTEVKLSESHGSMDARVTPSVGDKVKGIVTVEATNVPSSTQLVAVAIGKELGEDAEYEFIRYNQDGVWDLKVDTAEYENGLYKVGVVAQIDGNSPPSAIATGQIIIEN